MLGISTEQVSDTFEKLLGSPDTMIVCTAVVIAIFAFICAMGIRNGVE